MNEKRDNGKFLYIAVAIVVVMLAGLFIDSGYGNNIGYEPGKSIYSVEIAPSDEITEEQETVSSDEQTIEEESLISDEIDQEQQVDNNTSSEGQEPEEQEDAIKSEPTKTAAQEEKPKPTATKAPSNIVLSKSDTVYITASGSKFHIKNDCGNMNPDNAKALTVEEALAKGLEPCKRCLKNVQIN